MNHNTFIAIAFILSFIINFIALNNLDYANIELKTAKTLTIDLNKENQNLKKQIEMLETEVKIYQKLKQIKDDL